MKVSPVYVFPVFFFAVYFAFVQNLPRARQDATGNKCDASGWYPGEARYKDPIRPNVSFAEYLKQKAEKEAKEAGA